MDKNVDAYACLNSEYMHILRVSKSHELASIKNSEQVYQKKSKSGHDVAPNFFTMEFYKGAILWSFSYNSFVKLSIYYTVHLVQNTAL